MSDDQRCTDCGARPAQKHSDACRERSIRAKALGEGYVVNADRGDWTADDLGRSNSSVAFLALIAEVERILRQSGWALVNDGVGSVARTIMANLAHGHNVGPRRGPSLEEGLKRYTISDAGDWTRPVGVVRLDGSLDDYDWLGSVLTPYVNVGNLGPARQRLVGFSLERLA